MDKDVLIRFVQFLETIFGRINSKRLMVFYGYLLFLLYSKEMTEMAVWCGAGAFLVTMALLMFKSNDTIAGKS